jgi:hypothetical protein
VTLKEKIKKALGRVPELIEITHKGQKGYLPLYFNYEYKNKVSELFSKTEKGAYENLYKYIIPTGDIDGTDSEYQRTDRKEDPSA